MSFNSVVYDVNKYIYIYIMSHNGKASVELQGRIYVDISFMINLIN